MASKGMKISALGALLLLAFGVWCSNLAASNLPPLAARQGELEPGCAEAGLVFGRIGCAQLDIDCSFEFIPRSSSKTAPSSLPSDGLLKGGNLQIDEGLLAGMTEKTFLWGEQTVSNSRIVAAPKTSLHLRHSVLIL